MSKEDMHIRETRAAHFNAVRKSVQQATDRVVRLRATSQTRTASEAKLKAKG